MNVIIILSALAHFNTQPEEKYGTFTTKEEGINRSAGFLTWPLPSMALKHPLFIKCIKGRICTSQLPFPFNIYENAIYCMSNEKCSFQRQWQQVLVKWSSTICYRVPYSHLQWDKLHFRRVVRAKGSWHVFIDLHRLYACIPVCRQIVPQVNSRQRAGASRKLESSRGSQDRVSPGKRDTSSLLESQNLY